MGVRTRSTTSSPVKAASGNKSAANAHEPLKTFILPQDRSPNSRFVLLSHPRTQKRARYFFCPRKGLFEFKKICTHSADPRSILFTSALGQDGGNAGNYAEDEGDIKLSKLSKDENISQGHVSKAADLLVATPVDSAFLLLPVLTAATNPSGKTLFQPLDDIMEECLTADSHLRYVFKNGRPILENAMERFCDMIDAGDEKMYRLNETKLLRSILERAERAVAHGLPPSLEEKFVTRALETPVLSIKREESTLSTTMTVLEKGSEDSFESPADSFETQSTTASTVVSTVFSEASSTATSGTLVEESVPGEISQLQRLKTTFNFITSSYIPIQMEDRLVKLLESDQSPIDFKPLGQHLKTLAALRAEAISTRSFTDFSRKRGNGDEYDEATEARAEKKRKLEEEEKRKKAGESRGVRDLKKVNVSGMKKMSAFFAKKPVPAEAKA